MKENLLLLIELGIIIQLFLVVCMLLYRLNKSNGKKTKLFLDSGDPLETQEVSSFGKLDGQTTNPSLIAKSPQVLELVKQGKKFTSQEVFAEYRKIVLEISRFLPQGDISIEVYSDLNTTAEQMIEQARIMNTWIPNGRIKLPTTPEGLKALQVLCKENIKLNMTLCFTQEQAAAIYNASLGSTHEVYVSPFVGRLLDKNINGFMFVDNVIKMLSKSDGHLKVLAASIRDVQTLDYFNGKADIITVPAKVLEDHFKKVKEKSITFQGLIPVLYKELDLNKDWKSIDIRSDFTNNGVIKFAQDWSNLVSGSLQ